MKFIEKYVGQALWTLTNPAKLTFGLMIMMSGSALAAHNLLIL